MSKIDLKNCTPEALQDFSVSLGEKPFRGRQVSQWVYEKEAQSFLEMTNLSKSFRELLDQKAYISHLTKQDEQVSIDGTTKYLFRLHDGLTIETVLIPEKNRNTLCISTQVGCKMGCRFCLTARGGFKRSLNQAEIIDQVLTVKGYLAGDKDITNIVIMGMGEPLDNYNSVLSSIKTMISPEGMKIPGKRITLSTVGLVPLLQDLAKEALKIRIAVSLNATTDAIRSEIMPINRKYPLTSLIKACQEYPLGRGKTIMFEYVMLKGINDSLEDAKRLVKLLSHVSCKINLIPFNYFKGAPYEPPSIDVVEEFHAFLLKKGVTALTRKSKGQDIFAACGQLSEKDKKR